MRTRPGQQRHRRTDSPDHTITNRSRNNGARADELAASYQHRKQQTGNDQLKTHLRGTGKILRSRLPDLVHLRANYRALMRQLARFVTLPRLDWAFVRPYGFISSMPRARALTSPRVRSVHTRRPAGHSHVNRRDTSTMPTNRHVPEHPEPAPDAAVGEPDTTRTPNQPDAAGTVGQTDGETLLREWEGLPPDWIMLVPAFRPVPMRTPDHAWAIRVNAVGIVEEEDPDRRGTVDLFAGSWADHTPPSGLYDGDLVLRLTPPANPAAAEHTTDVQMLLAHHGHWQLVGLWPGIDDSWPRLVAPTAKAMMDLHTELAEAGVRCDGPGLPASAAVGRSAGGGLVELLKAELVTAGDEFIWDRRQHGVRHMVRGSRRRHPRPHRRPGMRHPYRRHNRTGRDEPGWVDRLHQGIRRANPGRPTRRGTPAARNLNPCFSPLPPQPIREVTDALSEFASRSLPTHAALQHAGQGRAGRSMPWPERTSAR